MASSKRKYKEHKVLHIYQRTNFKGIIFYRLEDYLVFFTIFCTTARKLKIRVLSLCLMPNHIHLLILCHNNDCLSKFVQIYTSWFVKEYNRNKGRTGDLFVHNFGSAVKWSTKDIMSSIAYLGNNPVLKNLCARCDQYRWSFMAYAASSHPFSSAIVIRRTPFRMKNKMKWVKVMIYNSRPLFYHTLYDLLNGLTPEEREQMVDYIIHSYNVIDYDWMTSFYGDYTNMLLAINANNGNEYDIKEDWDQWSDKPFEAMIAYAEQSGLGGPHGFNFQNRSDTELRKIAKGLAQNTKGNLVHIAKFLHIEEQYAAYLCRL